MNETVADYPDVASQWHPTKNGSLTPDKVTSGSKIKVWWQCNAAADHEWQCMVRRRTKENVGCPCCIGRKVVTSNCLATTHPNLLKEWHSRNDKPGSYFTYGSGVRVWWCCCIGHEWQTAINNRTLQKQGCPYCARKKTCIENSIVVTHTKIAQQWHPVKNGSLAPHDVVYGTNRKVWWQCPVADDHEWIESINIRTSRGYGCPYCSNNRLCKSNCLANVYPDIAQSWHPTKNGNLTPKDVIAGGTGKIWWQCPVAEDHEWKSMICCRIKSGCPVCMNRIVVPSNCLATTHPDLAAQWHPTKNGKITPYDVTCGSNQSVWWQCPVADDHEWKTNIYRRANLGGDCICCQNKKVVPSNCLATTHPDLAAQWHPTKNGNLTPKDVTNCKKKIWWKCSVADDHEWAAMISSRIRDNRGCPFCVNQKVTLSNCLATTHPDLAAQWHPTKNAAITPYDVTCGSNQSVWWQCPVADDHEWKTNIYRRANLGGDCICCQNKKVVPSNCLATTHPDLAAQWHPTKNGNLTPKDVVAGAAGKVWWRCGEGHEWRASLHTRAKGCGCPTCRESKGEKSVSEALESLGLPFDRQITFNDCRNRNRLPFDFGTTINGTLCLIEYQGQQHYEPVAFGSKSDNPIHRFELVKMRDEIKQRYCKKKQIPFLLIPYWDIDNVKSIVQKFVSSVENAI